MTLKNKKPYSLLFRFLTIMFVFGFSLLQCYVVNAADLKFTWEPPENTNPDHIGGYFFYWGTESQNYVNRVHLGNVYETTVKDLIEGNTYYFALTSYYIGAPDIESDFSTEIVKTISSSTQQSDADSTASQTTTDTTGTTTSDESQTTTGTTETVAVVSSDLPLGNQEPIADAGGDQIEAAGQMIILDGSNSSDPDVADIISYSWTQLGGPDVALQQAETSQAMFTLPFDAPEGQIFSFQLTVTDSEGLQSTDTCSVGVAEAAAAFEETAASADATEGIDITGSWGSISKKKQGKRYMLFCDFNLRNLGTENVGSVRINFYHSDDDMFDESDYKLTEHKVRNLNAGATVNLGIRVEDMATGSQKWLIAVIDPSDNLSETNEDNNISVSPVVE